MNLYFNSDELYNPNQEILLKAGTTLYCELENAREHGLGEEKNITYRIMVDDMWVFNPFRKEDMNHIRDTLRDDIFLSGKFISKAEYMGSKYMQNRYTNKAFLQYKMIRKILEFLGYNGFFFLEGDMQGVYLLSNTMGFVTDSAGYNARTAFRKAQGYDPVTKAIILKPTKA